MHQALCWVLGVGKVDTYKDGKDLRNHLVLSPSM